MAKINLVEEVLNHNDAEIIEYLYGLSAALHKAFNGVEDPMWLLAYRGEVEQIYSVLRALNSRNKENDV